MQTPYGAGRTGAGPSLTKKRWKKSDALLIFLCAKTVTAMASSPGPRDTAVKVWRLVLHHR